MELGLKGKRVLVMASSQGLGKAIAELFVKEEANVMLASRNIDRLKEVQAEFESFQQGKVKITICDITQPTQIQETIDKTIKEFGGLDILINNAGGPPAGGFEDFQDEDWQSAFELNLLSYVRIIRMALPHLKEQGGRIINIASSSIREPIPGLILSNTFRMGIVGLAKTLADELGPYNILVNTVAPGRILTDRVSQLDKINADKKKASVKEIKKTAEDSIPLGRSGTPEEFAKVVIFLSSEANTYMTGSSFFVDGGKLRSI
ncbi:SDR family oxidoreductase [Lederbergia galactosidilytica]|uniref:3-oxoacyl-ACP reductase n=1 Tax=Lederbergia galactosidilytica TaxID=217031 RepID=A0A0Q9Y272_9BACI|nr:SDR family oxidoreductase [Lederbergia galactosidilytica]KRG10900.1 3-oxoacyl-ACP reductase [Lederbergia galactosidilytica]KRG16005.1 3-oxoacyl-ACP reductase [Virgibacillus soli]MBP1915603.1 3-oxoacyl-[acyl-carrier protein] reductase [Lederbergia galactosidilytica]OAK72959.1 3-oxoacyl-ACP reductase [Lederbergia galactosidilytica]